MAKRTPAKAKPNSDTLELEHRKIVRKEDKKPKPDGIKYETHREFYLPGFDEDPVPIGSILSECIDGWYAISNKENKFAHVRLGLKIIEEIKSVLTVI